MYNALWSIGGASLLVLVIGLIVAGYIVHMYHILKDVAHEDAVREADELFDDYVHNCRYRIHQTVRIVDEMEGAHKK